MSTQNEPSAPAFSASVALPEHGALGSLGERFDAIAYRMDAAYAARRPFSIGTPEYATASGRVERVYDDLRALNALVASRAIGSEKRCGLCAMDADHELWGHGLPARDKEADHG